MKLQDRLLYVATCLVLAWVLIAFYTISDSKGKLYMIKTFDYKANNGRHLGDLMEEDGYYEKKVHVHLSESSKTEGQSKKSAEATRSSKFEAGNVVIPIIPGQSIIPTTPEMTKNIEWLARQLDNVPEKSREDMGERVLKPSKKRKNVSESDLTLREQFHMNIRQHELYSEDSDLPDRILDLMAHEPITYADQKSGGTQLKVFFTLKDGTEVIFKPQRFPRAKADTWPDHFYFSDFERHFSEIASFHLDRMLGFRRAPPVAGRRVNISADIFAFADDYKFMKTFYFSPANNFCFYGQCDYYCDDNFAACGDPWMLEGAMIFMLPPKKVAEFESVTHPWKRSYSKRKQAKWQGDPNYCSKAKKKYDLQERRFLDIMDLSVFDFLTGNLDRHSYVQYEEYEGDSSLLHLDQGRGFGKPFNDDLSCLAPITHCCMIRRSTLARLVSFYHGPLSLGSRMKKSMARDLAAPVLLDKHLRALDRRVPIVLNEVAKCAQTKGVLDVILDDGF